MDREEEEEALFEYKTPSVISNTTPTPSYYVQSPSTISNENSFEFHPNSNPIHILCLSPRQIKNGNITKTASSFPEASRRFTFSSRCSSTRESLTHLFVNVQEKSVPYGRDSAHDHDHAHHGFRAKSEIVDREGNHDGVGKSMLEKEEGYGGNGGLRKYMSFRTYNGSMWICLQLSWRFMVSLFAALLVFYMATKPPLPRVSMKVAGIREFELGEGVDRSGVLTKIMNCNTTVELNIDNQSKVFALYLHPPSLQISFQGFTFASSQGEKLIVESQQVKWLKLYVGTRNKPVYGAGRMIQDMLNSSPGLPMKVTVDLMSKYRIVGRFLKSRFHHRAQCFVVLVRGYDAKHRTHHFNATCSVFTS